MDIDTAKVETPKEYGVDSKGKADRWKVEIRLAKKEMDQWREDVNRIIERYRDEAVGRKRQGKRFNILWSNVQTLQPAIYSQAPTPQVERRYKDKDRVGRRAAQILERTLSFLVQPETFDSQMKSARDDYLLAGRGQVWVRYVPTKETVRTDLSEEALGMLGVSGGPYENYSPEDVQQDEQSLGYYVEGEEVVYEEVVVDKLHWNDFFHNPARCWEEVRWVGKRVYMRRDQLVKRFGEEIGSQVSLNYSANTTHNETEGISEVEQEAFKQAEVYEIWDKESRKVYWVCDDFHKLLDEQEDPLGLHDFFPCPRPLYATMTAGSLIPVPDALLYRDQAKEMDELTARIALLNKAVRVAFVYEKGNQGIQRLVSEKLENEGIGIDGWTTFHEKGGLKGCTDFLDLTPIVQALQVLYQSRETTKQEIYEITGIADVIRGSSHPRETAAAQQVKAQFASTRLQERQTRMQQFARDVVAIMGEIVSEQFSPDTMWNMGGVSLLEDGITMEEFQAGVALLRDEASRSFRIDVETDSTIAVNRELEKKMRIEAVEGIGRFIKQTGEVGAMEPQLMPFLINSLMFATRSFKAGRQLEASLEDALEVVQKKTQEKLNAPPQPPPEVQQMQMQMQMKQQELQMKQQEAQQKAQIAQMEQQRKQQEAQAEHQRKMEEAQAELALDRQKAEAEMALKREVAMAEIELDRAKAEAEVNNTKLKIDSDFRAKTEVAALNNAPPAPTRKVARAMDDPENPGQRIMIIEDAPTEVQ